MRTGIKRLFLLLNLILLSVLQAETLAPLDSAVYLIRTGGYSDALTILQQILREDQTDTQAWFNCGLAYQNLLQHNKAIDCLQKANNLESENLPIMIALGRSYLKLGYQVDAQPLFEAVVYLDSTNSYARIQLGEIYMDQNDYQRAFSIYFPLLADSSLRPYALLKMGQCQHRIENFEEAKSYLEEAYGLDPENPMTVLSLCAVYENLNEMKPALDIMHLFLQKHPDHIAIVEKYAALLFKIHDWEKAGSAYIKLISIGQRTATNFQRLGFCYYYTEKIRLAHSAFLQSYSKDEQNALTCFYLGLTYRELDNTGKAKELLQEAVRLCVPSFFPDIHAQLAAIFESEEKYLAAIEAYSEAEEYAQDRHDFLYYIAAIYDRYLDDGRQALQYFQKFLAECPDCDSVMRDYAEMRVQKIQEDLFLNKK